MCRENLGSNEEFFRVLAVGESADELVVAIAIVKAKAKMTTKLLMACPVLERASRCCRTDHLLFIHSLVSAS
jgi:hypothetical protein